MADLDIAAVFFKWIQFNCFFTKVVKIVRHISYNISEEDYLTDKTHTHAIYCNGKIFHVFIEYVYNPLIFSGFQNFEKLL